MPVARTILLATLAAVLTAALPSSAVTTPFEDGQGRVTPTYEETVAWCRSLAESSPILEYGIFGTSPLGRDLPLVVASTRGAFSPEAAHDAGAGPVLLVQACIHAGESCGKDAGMLLLRDLAEDPALASRLLDRVTLLFIPIFNVDGHERFGPYNRINQNGPERMGWRVTAQNLNLNRDYLKADTPEMRAWLRLWNTWSPDFFIDIHSTDGADYQYAVTYSLETGGNLDSGLTGLVREYEKDMIDRMAASGEPMIRYVAFRNWHDPRNGLVAWAAGPRFSQGYAAVRNRPGLLIETHMLKDYATRVEGAGKLWRLTLDWLGDHADELLAENAAADARTAAPAFREQPLALSFKTSDEHHTVDFKGIAYFTETSAVTGGTWSRFTGEPQAMQLEFYDTLVPDLSVRLPAAYIVPPQWQEVIALLKRHGAQLSRLDTAATLPVRIYRFAEAKWQQQPYEGRHPVEFQLRSDVEERTFPAGSVVVAMDQPAARAIAHMLEPLGPDSLVRWGFFDPVFARVEYAESYVIEQMIPDMLVADPALADSLAAAKAADPEFAANPGAIRDWFYRRTPFFDSGYLVYPVGMIDDQAAMMSLRPVPTNSRPPRF